MRALIIAALAACMPLAAEESPKPVAPTKTTDAAKPKPLPIEDQEKLSRLMIRVQGAQLEVFQVRAQEQIDGLQLRAAEIKADRLSREYREAVAALGTKYGCPGCGVDVDKNWLQPEVKR